MYTTMDEKSELEFDIEQAIAKRDEHTLRKLAHIMYNVDEEAGLQLLETANRIARNRHSAEWAYDEWKDNQD
jgi:hypothetical protein